MQTDELLTEQTADIHQMGDLQDMIEAGVFYGRKKTRTHPRMKQYVFTNRGGVEIIDLSATLEQLKMASEFLAEKIHAKLNILFVATQPAARELVELAKEFKFPHVSGRWIGGTLTNFKTISKRISHLKQLRADRDSGELEKYKKKERVKIDKEIKKLEGILGGLENLDGLPGAMVVVDPMLHLTAVREANKLGVPVVAFSSTDTDPKFVDYLIPGNSSAQKSITWFVEKLKTAVKEAQAQGARIQKEEEAQAADTKEKAAENTQSNE